MSARVYGLGVVFWSWLAAGCGEGGEREVTWHRDVRPIAAAMCADCHTDSAAVPFDVEDPAAVAEWADPIVASVLARSMPPWGMDASCREVPGSRWLSDAQLDAKFLELAAPVLGGEGAKAVLAKLWTLETLRDVQLQG